MPIRGGERSKSHFGFNPFFNYEGPMTRFSEQSMEMMAVEETEEVVSAV